MIASKVIFQSLAGVVAVGSVGGVFIASSNKETKPVINENQEIKVNKEANIQTVITPKVNNSHSTNDFYLVSSGDVLATQNTETLLTIELTKNYKCVNSQPEIKEIDEDCTLYSLTANDKKTIEMSKIQTFISNPTTETDLVKKTESKTEITSNKFFLLKANSSLFPEMKLDASEEIKLINKTENVSTQTNTFGNFKVHAKISKDSITGKTDLLIAEVEKDSFVSSASFNTKTEGKKCWQAYFSNNEQDCFLIKLSPSTTHNNFNFADLPFEEVAKKTNAKKGQYYMIKFTNTKPFHFIDSHKNFISFYDVYGEVSTEGNFLKFQNTKFLFEASAFALLSSTSPTKFSEVIIVK